MSKDSRFLGDKQIVPLKAPIDSAGTAYATPYFNLKNALSCTIFFYMGVVTATSADQNIVLTVEASTAAASNATEVALSGAYRKSGATGTNPWGARTTFTSTGISLDTTAEDGKLIAIDIDPADIIRQHGQDDAVFVRLVVGIDAGGTVTLNAAWAELEQAYPQVTVIASC